MFTSKKELTNQEEAVVEVLLAPYGVEMTSTDILRKTADKVSLEEVNGLLESLEVRGYLKGRLVMLNGYLVERKVYRLNHSRLFTNSKNRLQTRMILDRIFRTTVPL